MMQPIQFFVEGLPKGQPRPKAFVRGGHAAVYDPGTAEGWKGQVAVAARAFLPPAPILGPLKLTLGFWLPRPKAHYLTGKRAGELRNDAPLFHTGKPDADNFAKAVMDALTMLRLWQDDSQISVLHVYKLYQAGRTGCFVTIQEAPRP